MAENDCENRNEAVDENEENIITLTGESGERTEFREIAGLNVEGMFYEILQPLVPFDGMGEDDALVFKVTKGEDGNAEFEIEIDDDVLNLVFEAYQRSFEEATSDGACHSCGCGCEDCEGDCHSEECDCCEGGTCDCHHDDGEPK